MNQPTKLFNQNFFLLWQGQFISRLGVNMYGVAMALFLKHTTGSATLMGLMWMFSGLPIIILGPFAGIVADRFSRRKILIISDVINAIAVSSFSLYLFKLEQKSDFAIIGLFAIGIILGITGAFFNPAVTAAIPDIVPRSKIAAANSMGQISMQVTAFMGQALGSMMYAITGAPAVCLINGLGYAYGGISKMFIHIPQALPSRKSNLKENLVEFKNDLIEGLKFVWHNRGLRTMIYISAITNLFTTPILPLLPFYVEDCLKIGAQWYGFFLGMTGIGALFGFAFAGLIKIQPKAKGNMMILFIILMSLGYGLLGLVRVPTIALGLAFFGGFMGGYVAVNISVVLQLTTPTEIRGRVMALLTTLMGSLMPIGMGLGGYIGDLLNKNIPLIYASCGAIMASLTMLVALNKQFRDFLAHEQEIKPILNTQKNIATADLA
ncbi:MAG: MFS transporter [candidate division KSB1 bacterium]|nr:MFS transporter [candidate division KSB1 bacterium]MDZ7334929.1 MFS transporter [candidate division KSB1 bacterium]MDZ7357535.1 MFS transporter [candidate division KSB1 bacterium]